MRKIIKKTLLIFLIILIMFTIAIFTFEYLVNQNRFTGYIEGEINNKLTDVGKVEIGGIYCNLFSGISLKDISFHGGESMGKIKLKCESLGIKFKLTELLYKHIRKIEFEKPEFNFDLEEITPLFVSSDGGEFEVKELFPEDVYIESVAVTKAKLDFTAYDYLLNTSDLNLLFNDVQLDKPLNISINGKVLTRNLSNKTASSLQTEFRIKSGYNILNDELTIVDGSSLSIGGVGTFGLKGVVSSLISDPTIEMEIESADLVLHNIPNLLKDFDFFDLSPLTLTGESEIVVIAKGDMEEVKLNVDALIGNLNVMYEDMVFNSDAFKLPMDITIYPSDKEVRTIGECEFFMDESSVWLNGEKYVAFRQLPIKLSLDYPDTITIYCDSVDGDLLVTEPVLSFKEFVSRTSIEFQIKDDDKLPFNGVIESLVSDDVVFNALYDYDDGVLKKTNVRADNVDCGVLLDKFKFIMPEELRGWSYGGNVGFDLFLDAPNPDNQQEVEMITNVKFSDVKFASPEYDYFGERINGTIDISLLTDYNFTDFSTRVIGGIEPFLIGIGSFSTDMRERKISFFVESLYDTKKDVVSDISASMTCYGVGEFLVYGGVDSVSNKPLFDINMKINGVDNANFFETFVKDSVEFSLPELHEADVGGVSNADLTVKGSPESIQVKGVLGVDDASLKISDTVIEGGYIHFPVSIKYPTAFAEENDNDEYSVSNYGTVRIDKLSYDFLEIYDFEMSPSIVNNRFSIEKPISIPVFGGTIEVPHIFVDDITDLKDGVGFSFQLNEIDLNELCVANGLTPFEGDINTSLISFKQEGVRQFSEGEMKFSLFGGDIIIDDLVLNDFMSSLMGIEFSAKVNHLDLSEMSKTFQEWGNVSGIINGSINNFKIVAGEPSSFDLELQTEKKKRVKQFVSAAFLKSFVPGVANILDTFGFTSYGYEVIGLRAKLENDYIEFDGAVEEDGKGYFMKGSGLKKLNIVFSKDDRRMKFSRFMNSFDSMMGSDFDETQVQLK